MSAVLTKMEDPRDALERARLPELVRYARANGMPEVSSDMPAILIRRKLRERGLTRINVQAQVLGAPTVAPLAEAAAPDAVDAEADLARQFATARKTPAQMSIQELGAEMKRLNIKRDRRDNMTTMRAKIEQHGQ